MSTRNRKYRYSTDAIEYSVDHLEDTFAVPNVPITCRGFVTVALVEARLSLYLCLACHADDAATKEEFYYQFQEKKFAAELREHFPDISAAAAARVIKTFMGILQIANATHVCPETAPGAGLATSHLVHFNFHHHHQHDAPPESDDIILEEDEPEPEPRPATTGSIMELLKASNEVEDRVGEECPICMDDMEKARVLKMPCSHRFHRDCLIKWLNKSHCCPLCRYEMPQAQIQYYEMPQPQIQYAA